MNSCFHNGFPGRPPFCYSEGLKGNLEVEGTSVWLSLRRWGLLQKRVYTLAPYLEITYQQIDLGIELLDQLFARFEKPVEAF